MSPHNCETLSEEFQFLYNNIEIALLKYHRELNMWNSKIDLNILDEKKCQSFTIFKYKALQGLIDDIKIIDQDLNRHYAKIKMHIDSLSEMHVKHQEIKNLHNIWVNYDQNSLE